MGAPVLALLAFLILPFQGGEKISVAARLSQDGVRSGATMQGALLVTVGKGWHINSAFPSDENLVATSASFSPAPGLAVADVRFPHAVPRKFPFSDTPIEVYEGSIVVRFTLAAATGTPPGTLILPLDISYQACNDDVCLAPATVHLEIPVQVLPPDATPAPANPDLFGPEGDR